MRLLTCALWSPAGKGLTSWLLLVVGYCEFVTFQLVSWSGVVLDCIDSLSLHPYLLCIQIRKLLKINVNISLNFRAYILVVV